LGYACPAAVYEYQDAEGADADSDGKKFVINSQNCIHVSFILFEEKRWKRRRKEVVREKRMLMM
jgi:hypothetical protein